MPDQTAQEPTMEEILASIRRIISEDEAPQGEDEAIDAGAYEEEEGEPESLDVEVAARRAHAAQEEVRAPEPEPQPQPEPVRAEPAPAASHEPLVSRAAASVAASAFGQLSAAVTQPRGGSPTIEELVREMLAPMLRDWLDQNLPAIVQAAVRDEVERISRGRVG
jgi:cell pole-organizing protein PopZ